MADPGSVDAITIPCPLLPQIKDAIKCAKKRKLRPSFCRIVQWLRVHQHLKNSQTVRSQLETAVQQGLLFVVYSQGLPCYKDPDSLKSIRTYAVKTVKNFRRAVVMSVKEIGDPDGTTAEVIVQYIRATFKVDFATLPEMLQPVLAELVHESLLVEQSSGRYKYPGYSRTNAKVLRRAKMVIDPITKIPRPPKPGRTARLLPDSSSINNRAKRQRCRPKRWSSAISSESDTTETVPPEKKKHSPLGKRTETGTASTITIRSSTGTHGGRVTRSQISKLNQNDYECAACNFNTRTKADFLQHTESPAHGEKVSGKMVQCNVCHFCSRKVDKMTEHLQRHGCHEGKSIPCGLLASTVAGLPASK
ncbi:uncharacterized protein LOC129596478 [Paramacrobiotus metropolitanus]|uniref:uncharacterized protein LOC129596478 n=1 Tax=Paramacrobiotus metropolitanus TaxID=2943436 RepID=UPI0024465085|nr:uncharacterized protein LOC129596478 [Paramacrobiotus metropolitanus]XP_055349747.1 uncharacterized protein LOC129596478 [Paramacrobiotus metropolitanus]